MRVPNSVTRLAVLGDRGQVARAELSQTPQYSALSWAVQSVFAECGKRISSSSEDCSVKAVISLLNESIRSAVFLGIRNQR